MNTSVALRPYFVYNTNNRYYNVLTTKRRMDVLLMVLVELSDIDPLLSGFEAVPSGGLPFITIDKQRRFYLNASLREMIGIKAYDRVSLAYNPVEKTLAILLGDAANAIASTNYLVNGRHYMSAIRFCNDYQYDVTKAPYTFEFQRAGSVAGVYLFKLEDASPK